MSLKEDTQDAVTASLGTMLEESVDLDVMLDILRADGARSNAHLKQLISIAERYSSGNPSTQAVEPVPIAPLKCIFSKVRLDNSRPQAEETHYAACPLSTAKAFPLPASEAIPRSSQAALIEAMGKELAKLAKQTKDKPFAVHFEHLLSLLYRFTWCLSAGHAVVSGRMV
jgi:hypothetical protein